MGMTHRGFVKASYIYVVLCVVELMLIGGFFLTPEQLRRRSESSSQVWVSQWGGGEKDYARGVAVSGKYLYVTGDTMSFGPGYQSIFLLKYSTDGELIWNRTWGGEGYSMGRGIATSNGAVYVCGIRYTENESRALLLKFDEDGSLLWSRTWLGGVGAYGRGVALDSTGNVYVAGYFVNNTKSLSFLLKYDPEGSLIWTRTFNDGSLETGWAVTVDDGVYLCSTMDKTLTKQVSAAAEPYNMMTLRKLNYDGDLQWTRTWGIGLENYGLAVSSMNGMILQAGFTRLENGTVKASLLEYTSDGELVNNRLYGDTTESWAWSVTPAGLFVYIAGYRMSPGFMDARDAYLVKLDEDRNMFWYRTWGGYGDDIARSVVVDGDRVYVTGVTYGLRQDAQVLLIAYNSPNLQWDPTVLLEFASLGLGVVLILIPVLRGLDILKT
jgi:hypothetical protein